MPSNGGLFDFLMYNPMVKGPILTDDEARVLYDLWKSSRPGERRFGSAARNEIVSLKAKGYLAGTTDLELTDRGRKVIVEMVTREPSVLEKVSDPPPYSKIKAMANKRPRQTFVQKKAGLESKAFNLRQARKSMTKEAGLWDFMATPFRDWWSSTSDQVGEWFQEKGAHLGAAKELWNNVQRQKAIADRNLEQVYAQVQASGGVAPAVLSKAIEKLMPSIVQFKNEIGRVVPIPEIPDPGSFVDPRTGTISAQSFSNFYNMLSAAMGPMVGADGWNSVLVYEKNKSGAGASALKAPQGVYGPEDVSFGNEFTRLMAKINRRGSPTNPIVNPAMIQAILNNYTPPGGSPSGKKLVDVMSESIMRSGGAENIDNAAAEIAGSIMSQLSVPLATYRDNLRSSGRNSSEIKQWDREIDQLENDLFNNIKQVMQHKYSRVFGGDQGQQQQRRPGTEMAV